MNIDFVEPALPSRRAWILATLPALLALLMWGVLIYLHWRLGEQRERLAAAELAAKVPPATPTIPRPAPVYQAEALATAARASLPEADALAEIEHVEVIGIQIRSIDVNPARGIVVVELDAASDEALGDYLDQLNAGDGSPKWRIQKIAALANEARANDASANTGFKASNGHSVSISRGL